MYVILHNPCLSWEIVILSNTSLRFMVTIDHDTNHPWGNFQTKHGMKSSRLCLFAFCNWWGKVASFV